MFIAGKQGIGYLLRERRLGGLGGDAFRDLVCRSGGPTGGAFGGAAVGAGMVFVPCKDGLTALRVNASVPSFTVAWRAPLSANTPVIAYGLVWTVAANPDKYRGPPWVGTLVGLDMHTGALRAQVMLGGVPHYPSPAAVGGSLYVAGLGSVYAVNVT